MACCSSSSASASTAGQAGPASLVTTKLGTIRKDRRPKQQEEQGPNVDGAAVHQQDPDDALFRYLKSHHVGDLFTAVKALGVNHSSDLAALTQADLDDLQLGRFARKRFAVAVAEAAAKQGTPNICGFASAQCGLAEHMSQLAVTKAVFTEEERTDPLWQHLREFRIEHIYRQLRAIGVRLLMDLELLTPEDIDGFLLTRFDHSRCLAAIDNVRGQNADGLAWQQYRSLTRRQAARERVENDLHDVQLAGDVLHPQATMKHQPKSKLETEPVPRPQSQPTQLELARPEPPESLQSGLNLESKSKLETEPVPRPQSQPTQLELARPEPPESIQSGLNLESKSKLETEPVPRPQSQPTQSTQLELARPEPPESLQSGLNLESKSKLETEPVPRPQSQPTQLELARPEPPESIQSGLNLESKSKLETEPVPRPQSQPTQSTQLELARPEPPESIQSGLNLESKSKLETEPVPRPQSQPTQSTQLELARPEPPESIQSGLNLESKSKLETEPVPRPQSQPTQSTQPTQPTQPEIPQSEPTSQTKSKVETEKKMELSQAELSELEVPPLSTPQTEPIPPEVESAGDLSQLELFRPEKHAHPQQQVPEPELEQTVRLQLEPPEPGSQPKSQLQHTLSDPLQLTAEPTQPGAGPAQTQPHQPEHDLSAHIEERDEAKSLSGLAYLQSLVTKKQPTVSGQPPPPPPPSAETRSLSIQQPKPTRNTSPFGRSTLQSLSWKRRQASKITKPFVPERQGGTDADNGVTNFE